MNYPNQCYLELTQRCNLKCVHCFAEASWDRMAEMTLSDVVNIYQQIEDIGVIWVNLSGGEPLLNHDFFGIVEFAARQPYSSALLTNGTLWDKESIQRMVLADPKRHINIQISLDGPNHEVSQKQRPMTRADYERSLWTIQRFKSMGFTVNCLHVVSAATAPYSLETIHHALFDLGVHGVQVVPLFPSGRAAQFRDALDGFWAAWAQLVVDITLIKKYKTWEDKTDRFNVGFFNLFELVLPLDEAGMHDDIVNVWGLDVSSKEAFKRQTQRDLFCEAGRSELAISANCDLFPCVASLRTDFQVGNLREQSLPELWKEAELLTWFRTELGRVLEREPCCGCRYADICSGGCRVSALELTRDPLSPDPRCPLVRAQRREACCV